MRDVCSSCDASCYDYFCVCTLFLSMLVRVNWVMVAVRMKWSDGKCHCDNVTRSVRMKTFGTFVVLFLVGATSDRT